MMNISTIKTMINVNMHKYENIIKESRWVLRKKKNVVKDAPNNIPSNKNRLRVIHM